jgi:short-subunit dehydrogenase
MTSIPLVVITGANRGIGLALLQHYQQRGAEVVALCRQSSSQLQAQKPLQIIEGIDVAGELSVLAKWQPPRKIDVLINCAGILSEDSLASFTAEDLLQQFHVNSVGPLRMVQTLLPHLARPSKIAMITSRMGSIADNQSGGYYGYRASKAALNALSVSLAQDLKSENIAVALLHPGFVKTQMVNFQGHISPEESAQGLVARIDALNLHNTGGFWHANGEKLPW